MSWRVWRVEAAVAVAVLTAGCSQSRARLRWSAAAVRAAQSEGRAPARRAAEGAWRDVAALAPTTADAADALHRAAIVAWRGGRTNEAVALWRAALARAGGREQRARIAVDAALEWTRSRSPRVRARGVRLLVHVLARLSDTVGARLAVGGLEAALPRVLPGGRPRGRLLAALVARLGSTPAGDLILWWAARTLASSGRRVHWQTAGRLLRRLVREHPRSALWDDATFLRAQLAHRLGVHRVEIALYERILSHRRVARLFGNYETKFYHRSAWARARALWDDLGDARAAIGALEDFVATYPFSRYYPRALWMLARLEARQGRPRMARAVLERLVRERPATAEALRARRWLEHGRDPGRVEPWARLPEAGATWRKP